MIIVRLLSPEPVWLVLAPPSLLGRGSRHCYGINYTPNRIVRVIALVQQLTGEASPMEGSSASSTDPNKLNPACRCYAGRDSSDDPLGTSTILPVTPPFP